jgi:hypothetical protein
MRERDEEDETDSLSEEYDDESELELLREESEDELEEELLEEPLSLSLSSSSLISITCP